MLKNKLNNKQITIGSWITIGNTAVTEILAKAGFDWLVVDLNLGLYPLHPSLTAILV